MFEEQNEPVDIFSEVEPAKEGGMVPPVVSGSPLPAGTSPTPVSGIIPQIDAAASRGPSKILFVVIFLLLIGAVGGAVWYFILRGDGAVPVGNELADPNLNDSNSAIDVQIPEPENRSLCGNGTCDLDEDKFSCPTDCPLIPSACGDGICQADEGSLDCPSDCQATPNEPVMPPEPANQPIDTDGDGWSDIEEATLGTNPQIADTDADGLTDREELRQYSTDPTNPDSDGDSYIDGEEVRAGYDPNGPGKLFNLPQ
ncbi:TPA: hypothetical protein DEP86_01985 [Candidatus Uhrbacteria bacterium]|nr:hypothetical protein [Candidatus Uhrbacteria bacterium]